MTTLTIVDLLRQRALEYPDRIAYRFLDPRTGEVESITYEDLDKQSRAVASRLQHMDLANRPVLLLYPSGLHYVVGFFGCLFAGVIAVPLFPPRQRGERIWAVASDTSASVALTTPGLETKVRSALERYGFRQVQVESTFPAAQDEEWVRPDICGDTIAFLQYTSGSTGEPKGVMVSHTNVLHNSQRLSAAFGYSSSSHCVSWLPFFHDMGLIGGLLQPLHGGFPCTLMDPMSFVKHPVRWLSLISSTRATISGGPNFAYDLCCRKITPEQRQTLDLSSWEVAFNGAETIRPQTLERFTDTFAAQGFQRKAFLPCYGLAEATLMISGFRKSRGAAVHIRAASTPDNNCTREVVSCGSTGEDLEVLIVDPATRKRCADGKSGEIWVSGLSVAQGYWNRPDETAQTFHATLAGDKVGRKFLKTGDLGFLLEDELFVAGRLKDVIIIRGQNYYPEDIEVLTQQSHKALIPSRGAAFHVESADGEQLVMVQEIENSSIEEAPTIVRLVRESVTGSLAVTIDHLVLVKAGSILLTSSGKVQRNACRHAFVESKLQIVLHDRITREFASKIDIVPPDRKVLLNTPTDEREHIVEEYLRRAAACCLGTKPEVLDPCRSLTSFGLDSLRATQLSTLIGQDLEIELLPTVLLEAPNLATIADQILLAIDQSVSSTANVSNPKDSTTQVAVSPHERRLWNLSQWASANPEHSIPGYNLAALLELQGELNVVALENSLNELLRRHDILRTHFTLKDDRLCRVIEPYRPRTLAVEVLEDRGIPQADAEIRRIAAARARVNLDLGCPDGLLSWQLWRTAADQHTLLLIIPHIISDGWSAGIFVRELASHYAAYVKCRAAAQATLPTQFTDYLARLTEQSQSPSLESHFEYWQNQLVGVRSLELPTDRPRPPVQSLRGGRIESALDKDLVNQLKALGLEEEATPFMAFTAALQVLFFRYSRQNNFALGVVVANRTFPGADSLIGYCAEAIPLCSNFKSDWSFRQVLRSVRRTALDGYAHQVPFHSLLKKLRLAKDTSRNPVFQVVITLQDSPLTDTLWPGLHAKWSELHNGTAIFDLSVAMCQLAGGDLHIQWEFDQELFDWQSISRMAKVFEQLLRNVLHSPSIAVSEISLLSEDERQRALVDWNRNGQFIPPDECVHKLFEQQSARTPDAIAISDCNVQLSYRELNFRADKLAHFLRQQGVRMEAPVAVALPRSAEMMVAILGVLKAGGAYLPLDPSYPQDRLRFMLQDSGAALLLSSRNVLPDLNVSCDVIRYEVEQLVAAPAPPGHGHAQQDVHSLLYVLYTSGSTGTPKAVMGTHQAAVNRFQWMWERFPFTPNEVLCQKTSLSFVDSVWECFGGLLRGLRTLVVPDEVVKDSPAMVGLLADEGVARMVLVPSLLHSLLANFPRLGELLPSLKLWVSSGEVLSAKLLEKFRVSVPSGVLVNLYGCSEVAGDITWHIIPQQSLSTEPPSIGCPLSNCAIYILDETMNPVPIGNRGEIYAGGICLSRGYLNRPGLTAERFLPDPFSETTSGRLYKTGDLGRYLPSGDIEFIGRCDHQVKLNGYRIETEEIERVLETHPLVAQVLVTLSNGYAAGDQLVAYIVCKPDKEVSPAVLRQHAEHALPAYMIPGMYVTLKALPLLPNGKIDRTSLPPVTRNHTPLNDVHHEPLTVVETALAGIWKKVLGISEIGVLDNFFDLGGHSLALLEVRAGIQETLGRQIPVTELFRHPTISALGHYISHGDADQDDIVAARRRASTQKEAMLTAAQSASHLRVAPGRLSP